VAETLRLAGVSAGYGSTHVIEDVAFSLAEGECACVIGRNGVGKTTVLETVMGHTRLHAGEIHFAGERVDGLAPHRRARLGLGYVPQEREVFPSLTVLENLQICATPGRWTLGRVFDLFPNLRARSRALGNRLSGGEQQMLAIARALLLNPRLLLMDEPTEGLAPVIVEGLVGALQRVRSEGGLTLLLVEQNASLALSFAERAIVLDRGRIVYDGPSRTLREDAARLARLLAVSEGG